MQIMSILGGSTPYVPHNYLRPIFIQKVIKLFKGVCFDWISQEHVLIHLFIYLFIYLFFFFFGGGCSGQQPEIPLIFLLIFFIKAVHNHLQNLAKWNVNNSMASILAAWFIVKVYSVSRDALRSSNFQMEPVLVMLLWFCQTRLGLVALRSIAPSKIAQYRYCAKHSWVWFKFLC